MNSKKIMRLISSLLGIVVFVGALFILRHELHKYNAHEIWVSLKNIPFDHLLLGLFFTCTCYLALTFYDLLGFRNIGNNLHYGRIALAAFVGYSFSHNIGLTFMTSGPVKYRIYSSWDVKVKEVAKVVVFGGLTFWSGFMTLMGLALAIEPSSIPAAFDTPIHDSRPFGFLLVGAMMAYLTLCYFRGHRRPVVFGHVIPIPKFKIAVGQILASCMEWMSASAILYVMFNPYLTISYPAFLAIFLFAYVAGFASQVPGGLGVFETVILISLKDTIPPPEIMAALLAYRAVYYILPLIVAIVLFGFHEIRKRRRIDEI